MDVIANGHEIDFIQNHANFNGVNNQVANGQLRPEYENGFGRRENNPNASSEEIDLSLRPWQSVIFPLILKIVHVLFRISIVLNLLFKRVQKKVVTNYYYRKICDTKNKLLADSFDKESSLKDQVRRCSSNTHEKDSFRDLQVLSDTIFNKKPSHIAFALLEANTFSIKDIGNLITWSVALGIKNISLYDLNGKLKGLKDILNCELLNKLPMHIKESRKIMWNIHLNSNFIENNDQAKSDEMYSQNSEHHEELIKIDILDRRDGQNNFNDLTQSVAQKVKSGKLTVDAINDKFIDSTIRNNFGFNDPDLLIRFGLSSSNLGFLPWHIRLTEIHDIPTHLDAECWDLFLVLLRYSKCEQRFGR